MEIEVLSIKPFEGKNGFKGYATVRLIDEHQSMIINGFTIGTTKTGKLIARPPQSKNEKDGKYYDVVTLEGDFMWTVSNTVIEKFNNLTNNTSSNTKVDQVSKSAKYDNPWEEQ